jgi:sulfate permease, SulP family
VHRHLAEIKPLSLVIAAVTFATMWKAGKLLPKVPPIIAAIAVGWTLHFVCNLIGLANYVGPLITSVSRPTMGVTALEYFNVITHGGDLLEFLPTIVGGAVALAIISSI